MMVLSGARVWFGVGCLAALAGCGGRTSTLLPDDPGFNSSLPSGADGGGGSSSTTHPGAGSTSTTPAAGAPSIGVGGGVSIGGSTGIAGAPSAGGSSTGGAAGAPAASGAAQACANFCTRVANSACGMEFGDVTSCTDNCTSELGVSDLCLQLGQAVMNCFLPPIERSRGRCANIDQFVASQCASQLDQFQQCTGSSVPDPTPIPVPPPPPPLPADCSSSGSTSAVTCDLTSKCMDGSFYMVNCKQISPNQSSCTCTAGNTNGGSGGQFTLNESVAFACYDGVSACGGPATLPK